MKNKNLKNYIISPLKYMAVVSATFLAAPKISDIWDLHNNLVKDHTRPVLPVKTGQLPENEISLLKKITRDKKVGDLELLDYGVEANLIQIRTQHYLDSAEIERNDLYGSMTEEQVNNACLVVPVALDRYAVKLSEIIKEAEAQGKEYVAFEKEEAELLKDALVLCDVSQLKRLQKDFLTEFFTNKKDCSKEDEADLASISLDANNVDGAFERYLGAYYYTGKQEFIKFARDMSAENKDDEHSPDTKRVKNMMLNTIH